MRFLSLFSGIEAASAAWAPLGWTCVAVSEIDKFANEVLRCRHPNVRNLGDVTKITETDIANLGEIDVVIFGSPCQDLSIGGQRKGLDGARSGLFFDAMRILAWSRFWCGTRFAVWENVPGAFSSNKGCDFAAVVDALSGLDGTPVPPAGWGTEGCAAGPESMVEWAVLDAQYFGVAQRRRRVFAVADFGNWASREPILLEPQSMRGTAAPPRATPLPVCLTARGAGSLDDRETYLVEAGGRVRRMTPLENERQQGFPDGHTDVRAGGTPDGPRYKALGNSMAVPVIEWIGRRIENAVLFGE